MDFVLIDGNEFFAIEGYGDFLVIKSEKIEYYTDLINSKSIKNIGINAYWGYGLDDFRFLSKCPKIEKIYIVGDDYDLTDLNHLRCLTFISTTSNADKLDFSNFPHLEYCCINWSKKVLNLEKSKEITHLKIYKYKAFEDIAALPFFNHLSILEIIDSSISSLKGIERYTSLVDFRGYYLSKLTNINAIAKAEELRFFILENCKRVFDYQCLEENKHLRKIILSNCGDIKSIKFIQELKELVFFTFMGSNVLDGDMMPCIRLQYFAFNNRKHYSHTDKEIKALG